ncbi:MAG TPA: sigma-70 family RNA polymerase sigma factor [Candidatus Paceibacterota bacterium]|nr:sigma-70 family RNA polymerase sigma factor [Candidatus Paceibacterota bacterium]
MALSNGDHLNTLAAKMKRGDRRAAAALYDDLAPKVYGFVLARTSKKEAAEDLMQDVFLKLIEKIESFDEKKGKFTVWFWQVVRNMLVDHYRGKKEMPFSAFEEEAVAAMAVGEMPDLQVKMRHDRVAEFVLELSHEERELFELRYVAEMPYREIASLLGKSEASLRVKALRIKGKIKKEFKHEA